MARVSRNRAKAVDADRPRPVPRSRAGGVWVALIGAALAVLLLLIFILQNGQSTDIYFFALDGQLPVGVALLLAGVLGVLAAGIPASARIMQLRRLAVRRDRPEAPVVVKAPGTGAAKPDPLGADAKPDPLGADRRTSPASTRRSDGDPL